LTENVKWVSRVLQGERKGKLSRYRGKGCGGLRTEGENAEVRIKFKNQKIVLVILEISVILFRIVV
jgi:hypothetical protein